MQEETFEAIGPHRLTRQDSFEDFDTGTRLYNEPEYPFDAENYVDLDTLVFKIHPNRVVAYCVYSRLRDNPEIMIVHSIATDQNFRINKLAKALMITAIRRLNKPGQPIREIHSPVSVSSQAFFDRLGFVYFGRHNMSIYYVHRDPQGLLQSLPVPPHTIAYRPPMDLGRLLGRFFKSRGPGG